jgi:hypothetical protein
LSSTSECFKKAKALIEQVSNLLVGIDNRLAPLNEDELHCLTRICVGNSVFLMKLAQKVRGDGKASGEVNFDFDATKQFCTIKID